MEWKYSSIGIRSLAFGIASLPYGSEVKAALNPATRAALDDPNSTKWHDGSVVLEAAEVVKRFGGNEGVEAMNYHAVKRSLGPVMAPFLKVSLALFGASPATLFSRMNENLTPVMRGVTTTWAAADPLSGRLIVTHPDPVLAVSWPCWRGSLRFTFDLCGVKGEIVDRSQPSSDRTLAFDLAWKKV